VPYSLVRLIAWEAVIMVLRICIIFLSGFLFHTMAFGQGGKTMTLAVSSPVFATDQSIPVRRHSFRLIPLHLICRVED
jgi:hypothetical protein